MPAKAGPNATHQLPILAVGLAIHTMTGNGTFETFADPAAMQQVSVFQPTVRYLQRLEILGPMAALGKLVDCLARAAKARRTGSELSGSTWVEFALAPWKE
jgi:hypothetical protein